MALDRETQEAISAAVSEGIRRAMETHPCRIPISDEQAREIAHVIGMIMDIGGNKGPEALPNGIETVRLNHQWMNRMRRRSDAIGMTVTATIFTILAGGALTAVWAGIKVLLKVGTDG